MNTLLTENQLKVLITLKRSLDENAIPFVAIGGLASILWGVRRPLADIDIQVDNNNLFVIKKLLSIYVTTDIRHYVTNDWDIQQMVLNIDNVNIDVCGADEFYVVKNGVRYLVENDIDKAEIKILRDVAIPVISRDKLISYKKRVARPVDLEDIVQLERKL